VTHPVPTSRRWWRGVWVRLRIAWRDRETAFSFPYEEHPKVRVYALTPREAHDRAMEEALKRK